MSTQSERLDRLEAAVLALTGAIETLVTPATSAPVAPAPALESHVGPSGKRDGRRFPCTVGCTRHLRSAARAASHDLETGHSACSGCDEAKHAHA